MAYSSTSKLLFVSYLHKNALGYGYGNTLLRYPDPLTDESDIRRIEEAIKTGNTINGSQVTDVVLLNWQRMESWR